MSGYWESILVILCLNVILAYAAFLPLAAGQVNLGIAGFMAIGAYVSAYLSETFGFPAIAAICIGALTAGLLAFFVAFPILRARAIYLALATLALGECVRGLLINLSITGGAAGYPVTTYVGLPVIAVAAVLAFVLVFFLFHTRFGLCVVAVEDDERVADLLGVNVRMTRVWAFAIGGFLAGMGGGLYGHHFSFIEGQYFTVMLSVYVVLYVLLGGAKSIYGPLAGAVFFTLLPELLRVGKEWRYALFAVMVLVIMAVRPEGLMAGNIFKKRSMAKTGDNA
jgi:branched-chain amino acid transport system permease protein